MKKRLLSVFLTLCMLLTLLPVTVSASTTTGNFIENPGGEIMTGGDQLTANGWNEDTSPVRGFSYPATDMGVTGYGGTHVMGFYCMGIPSSTASSCYQTFDVTSYTAGSNVSYTFSGLMTVSVQGTGTGTATLKIEQLDTNGNVVSSDSKTAAQPGNALISYTMTGTVVSGATQLRISIAADLNAPYGQNNDAFAAFDDLSLTLTTTPPLTITGGTEGTDYTYTGGVLTVKTATALTIANITPATATTDRVEVTSAAGANLTLAGVNIDVSGTSGAAAFKITSAAGAVNLTLADGSVNTLKSGANCAGLQKDNTSLLTISGGTSGTGALHAVGGSGGAGIGANPDSANGSSMLCAIEKADKTQTYTQNVTLPTAVSNSSTLMVAKDESVKELPKIVVGGLDKLAEAENADIYMTVTQKAADKNNAEQKTILVSADGQSVGMYLDVTLKKGSDALTEADSVLEIVIPYEFSGKNNVNVWRCHNGSAEKFTSLKAMPAAPYADMTFFADTHSGLLYIFAGKFSTYAVSCTYASTGAYGTGSDSAAAYPVDIDTSNIKNGTVTVSPASAAAGTAVILTAKPDAGYKPGKPTVTDGSGKTLALTDNGDGTYSFTMPGGRVSVSAAFLKSGSPFADVPETAYYFDAVLWAAGKGIAQGKTGTLFAPDGICTRAQAVTFLWRAMGSPEPAGKTSPFNDVSAGAYYYEAILWAAEKGIAAGIGGTAFSPDGTVTRAQAMTFLWRAAGKPAAGTPNPFSDVPADAYYRDAVIWAVAQKITGGTGAAAFYPADPCTRAQIVTFLWRCLGK